MVCAVAFTAALGFSLTELFRSENVYTRNIKRSGEPRLDLFSVSSCWVCWVQFVLLHQQLLMFAYRSFQTLGSAGVAIQTSSMFNVHAAGM